MKLAFMISMTLILPIFAAYFIIGPPQIDKNSEFNENVVVPELERFDRYCIEYYNSDPDISVEDDCNV